ncbi:hypothetical protein BC832DRAFT_588988 [Gaertneriomyces semiglobifer]|nr:hypothetical protein BC832DRAFT_588988 [Gaertneriomyces semiglobifer]
MTVTESSMVAMFIWLSGSLMTENHTSNSEWCTPARKMPTNVWKNMRRLVQLSLPKHAVGVPTKRRKLRQAVAGSALKPKGDIFLSVYETTRSTSLDPRRRPNNYAILEVVCGEPHCELFRRMSGCKASVDGSVEVCNLTYELDDFRLRKTVLVVAAGLHHDIIFELFATEPSGKCKRCGPSKERTGAKFSHDSRETTT